MHSLLPLGFLLFLKDLGERSTVVAFPDKGRHLPGPTQSKQIGLVLHSQDILLVPRGRILGPF